MMGDRLEALCMKLEVLDADGSVAVAETALYVMELLKKRAILGEERVDYELTRIAYAIGEGLMGNIEERKRKLESKG